MKSKSRKQTKRNANKPAIKHNVKQVINQSAKEDSQKQGIASSFGFNVFLRYTRAQAIADGVLVDVTYMAKEAGFRIPVSITCGAWDDCVEWTDRDSQAQTHQDQSGRLWDVLFMAFIAARGNPSASRVPFSVLRIPRDGQADCPELTELEAVIGPGDHLEPVLTIQLPGED
jgi:hypothetical protein